MHMFVSITFYHLVGLTVRNTWPRLAEDQKVENWVQSVHY